MQGGPALHDRDLTLMQTGVLSCEQLVTIRKGELAYQPLCDSPEPVANEFLKVRGQGGSWQCMFYELSAKACIIYENRPMACSLLDCTAPEPLLAITGKDLLTRFDCIAEDGPLLALVHQHEEECPCPDMEAVAEKLQARDSRPSILEEMTEQVNLDLAFRHKITGIGQLSVAAEMFYLGRPLFQLLLPLGVHVEESPTGLRLL
jgi:hypothetical protein